jgi:hypothetical protein
MDMHGAALPPVHGHVTEQDRKHPLFPTYRNYRSWCSRKLIAAEGFQDWLHARRQEEEGAQAAQHPEYPAFMRWMRANQGGARKCPAGAFPHNFTFWLGGGRW